MTHRDCSIVFLLLLASCSTRTQKSGHSFRVSEEDGVTIAETTGGPKYEGELFEYVPVLRLRSDDSNPESILSIPGSFLRGPEGCYYVPDQRDRRIAVFSPDGQYLRSFGRTGEGPGEFQSLYLRYMRGNRLVITDESLMRTTIYRTDGTLEQILRLTGAGSHSGIHPAPEGKLVVDNYIRDMELIDTNRVKRRVVVMDSDEDTLSVIETKLVPDSYVIRQYGRASRPIAYAPKPAFFFDPEKGILLTTGETPILNWYDLDGNLTKQIRLVLDPEPIGPDLRSEILARFDRAIERATTDAAREWAKDERKAIQIPEYRAFWTDIQIDGNGYYWLLHPIPWFDYASDRAVVRYRVLSPEGEYLGDTLWPVQNARINGKYLLGVVEDEETGELIPTVFEVRPLLSGFDYP